MNQALIELVRREFRSQRLFSKKSHFPREFFQKDYVFLGTFQKYLTFSKRVFEI